MKKYFYLSLLPLVLLCCNKRDVWINEFTFEVDGVHYDFSRLEIKTEMGKIRGSEFNVIGYRYSKNTPMDYLYYSFFGYNPTNCGDCDCSYGGGFIDRSVQKKTVFNVPDHSTESYFWIQFDKGNSYDAVSGYIEMNSANVYTDCVNGDTNKKHKAHGTFDFVMVNRENVLDTIHVTNGKFRYQCYVYMETYQVN